MTIRQLIALALLIPMTIGALAQTPEYSTNDGLRQRLLDAAQRSPGFVSVSELGRDADERPLWLVRAGSSNPAHPAILVVAGLDGRRLVGTELAAALVEDLARDRAKSADLLESTTLYIVPRLNPGAVEGYFARPREEYVAGPTRRDADRDGLVAEDFRDDLDGDGMISSVRVEDPRGTQFLDGEFTRDPRAATGEKGTWLVLSEGRDDDGDDSWNEEADAGTNLGRNFPTGYEWFARDAGRHQVSEPGTRALADFIIAHPSIAIVLVLGAEDNLLDSPPGDKFSDPGDDDRRPVDLPNRRDLPILAELGADYRKALSLDREFAVEGADRAARGGLARFVYFARGRLALATPGWTRDVQLAHDRTLSKEDREKLKDGSAVAFRDGKYRDWLKREMPSWWLGWKDLAHPDFKGRRAQVGGFAPFATLNPPPSQLAELATSHTLFMRSLPARLPRVGFREARMRELGGGLYEVRLIVENSGFMPDVLGQGRFSRHVNPTRVEFDGCEVIGGIARPRLDPLAGSGGRQELRRVVRPAPGADSIVVRVVSQLGGTEERKLMLTEADR